MLPENRAFWVRGDDDQEYGPVGLEELREWARENRAGLGTVVRRDEPEASWEPWQHYPELVALLAEVHVTSPVPGQPGLILAPFLRRVAAGMLDIILTFILAFPILIALAKICLPDWWIKYRQAIDQTTIDYTSIPPLPLYGQVLGPLIFILLLACYMAGFHAAHGQTPAKSILRLRVVDEYGRKPNLRKAFLRGLAFAVFFNAFFGVLLTYIFINPQRRALHDLVAGTYVVEA